MDKKECRHEWEWVFTVDCSDLMCKKCGKDVFDVYSKTDANQIININNMQKRYISPPVSVPSFCAVEFWGNWDE